MKPVSGARRGQQAKRKTPTATAGGMATGLAAHAAKMGQPAVNAMPEYTAHTYLRAGAEPLVKNVAAFLRPQSTKAPHRAYKMYAANGPAAKREAKRRRVADERASRRSLRWCSPSKVEPDVPHVLKVVDDRPEHLGLISYMRNPTVRGWTVDRSEAHVFPSKAEAEKHIMQGSGKAVPAESESPEKSP